MKLTLSSSPHLHSHRDTSQIMRWVMIAMIPGLTSQIYFFGWGVVVQLLLATVTALITEAGILALRKKNIERHLSDYSAVLTACLLAVSIPPTLPWWMTIIGAFFAIAIVKQLYGGLGYNLFNPAMVAYVVLLISFPAAMTQWAPAAKGGTTMSFTDSAFLIFSGFTQSGMDSTQLTNLVDGVTSATPLDYVKTGLTQSLTYTELLSSDLFRNSGPFQSSAVGWAWVSIAYLLGGLLLLQRRVISWHIPGSMVLSVLIFSSSLYLLDGDRFASPLFHLINGSVLFGAFFIATDPVSASTTPKGRVIFGVLIGFWIIVIRNFGGYPDAVAFAVIIMNMAVPLIDYYTRPRTYGHKKGKV